MTAYRTSTPPASTVVPWRCRLFGHSEIGPTIRISRAGEPLRLRLKCGRCEKWAIVTYQTDCHGRPLEWQDWHEVC